jgi:steroid 5-alpha reductase family enzyme
LVIFLFSAFLKNSSIYDPYWSVAPLIIIPLFIRDYNFKNLLLLGLIVIWGIRLTWNWAYSFKNLQHQDWRYTYYKNRAPRVWPVVNFFGIHLMPTIIVISVMLPAFTYLQSSKEVNFFTFAGVLLAIAGIFLEYFADRSAHSFRKQHPGEVNNSGLWKYSRHPNYLGEISFWWGIYFMLLSLGSNYFLYFLGPLANTLLFVFISIPLMEKRQLANKPDYACYQRQTSMLLLLPVKKANYEEEMINPSQK